MKALSFLTPLIVILFMACHTHRVAMMDAADSDVLYSASWNLAELDGQPVILDNEDSYAYLTFDEASPYRIYGYSGCNSIGGTYSIGTDNRLSFTPLAVTKRYCADNSIETKMLTSLRDVDGWDIANNQLVMYRDGEVVARFNQSDDLRNLSGKWQLVYTSDVDKPFTTYFPNNRPYITFTEGMYTVAGNSSCNAFDCPITLDANNRIKFGSCTSTKIACEGGGEHSFYNSLGRINNWKLTDDNTLVLMTDADTSLRFVRVKD
jgi:heat shock protein HslJ